MAQPMLSAESQQPVRAYIRAYLMQVEEITLMNTVFIRWDGHRILCPNSKLSADLFTNVTRSQKKGESYRVRFSYLYCA